MQPTPGFQEGWQSGEQTELNRSKGNLEAFMQGATTARQQEQNYTTLSPENMKAMHPAASTYLQGFGQMMPDGSMRVHNSILPKLSDHMQQQQIRDAKGQRAEEIRRQVLKTYINPMTGVPENVPSSVQMRLAGLGPDAPDSEFEGLAKHQEIRENIASALEAQKNQPDTAGGRPTTNKTTIDFGKGDIKVEKSDRSERKSIYDDFMAEAHENKNGAGPAPLYNEADSATQREARRLYDTHDTKHRAENKFSVTVAGNQANTQSLPYKGLAEWVNPETGRNAVNDPNMIGKGIADLQKGGYVNLVELGGAKDFVKASQAAPIAHGHVQMYRDIVNKYPDLFPPQAAGLPAAKINEYWNELRSKNHPGIAALDALEGMGNNIMAAMGPTSGVRYSVMGLKLIHSGLANPRSPASREAINAALDTADKGIDIAGGIRRTPTGDFGKVGISHTATPPAPAPSAGVSGRGWGGASIKR